MPSSAARLHRALIGAMLRHRPNTLTSPVTVAEIYQDLVPYRSVRSSLGFALNADYEHALLQLLAGVEGLARIEPAEVREALRLELESSNPNVGMFRGYAACDVWIVPPDDFDQMLEDARREEAAPDVAPGWSTPAEPAGVIAEVTAIGTPASAALHAESAAEPAAAKLQSPPSPVSPVSAESQQLQEVQRSREAPQRQDSPQRQAVQQSQMPAGRASRDATNCRFCESAFPGDRAVRFCPFCGRDQHLQLCGSCGEELEPGWKFCISCGESTG